VIALIVALIVVGFAFAGTETALSSLQRVQRQRMRQGTPAERRAARLLENRGDTLTSLLIGSQAALVGLAALGAHLAHTRPPHATWLNLLLASPILVGLLGVGPRALALRFNRDWASATAGATAAVALLLSPLRWAVVALVRAAARLSGLPDQAPDDRMDEDDLRDILEGEAAEVNDQERDIVEAVFDFDELDVSRLMTPRPDIFSLPLSTPWEDAIRRCHEAQFSRVPIYRSRPDEVVGVLLVKDLLRFLKEPPATLRGVQRVLLPPVFVPASKSASDLLREFLERKSHLSLVVDEHGALVGLITLDDLLAELLDHQTDEEVGLQLLEPGRYCVRAWVDVDDFAEETGLTLPEGEYNTVGGFVFHALGRVPQVGEVVHHAEHRFEVRRMQGRRIEEIAVTLGEAGQAAGGAS
jgi:putative hemolysin